MPTPPNILIVDDCRDVADSLAMVLTTMGYTTSVGYDGPTALDIARASPPDVVLLDLGMPGMDGYEVARRLRELLPHRRLLFVAITGHTRERDRKRSEESGITLHLLKPADPELLRRLIEAYCCLASPPDSSSSPA